jgi:hypothetical protein
MRGFFIGQTLDIPITKDGTPEVRIYEAPRIFKQLLGSSIFWKSRGSARCIFARKDARAKTKEELRCEGKIQCSLTLLLDGLLRVKELEESEHLNKALGANYGIPESKARWYS